MYIFAHVLAGVLLGLFFADLTRDRRAIPLCIFGAILPDLIDKPLALLVPELSSGRTIFHALVTLIIVLAIALAIYRYRHSLLGLAVAAGVFSHQILDSMWEMPKEWFFPLLGPFPIFARPDYTGYYLWMELSDPTEWLFLLGSAVILVGYYGITLRMFSATTHRWIRSGMCVILAGAGFFMIAAGFAGIKGTFLAPEYSAVTTLMAGVLALAASLTLGKTGNIPDDPAAGPDPSGSEK